MEAKKSLCLHFPLPLPPLPNLLPLSLSLSPHLPFPPHPPLPLSPFPSSPSPSLPPSLLRESASWRAGGWIPQVSGSSFAHNFNSLQEGRSHAHDDLPHLPLDSN